MLVYNPFGNKTLAMFAGSVAAKDYKYLCLIDDDVTIPEDMNFGKVLMSDRVKAICYPIRAVHPDQGNDDSYFIKWQGIEYKMADYAKMIQNQWSTVLYPHGACALWDRKVLIDCFRDHDTVFFADDVKMGLWFTRHGYEMRIHVSGETAVGCSFVCSLVRSPWDSPLTKSDCAIQYQVMVDTDAPASMIGPMPNFYNQRVRSWDMAEHAYAYAHVRVFFTTTHPTILGTIVMKWYQFYALYSIMADQLRCPVMILTSLVNARYFVTITGYFLLCYTAIVVVWDWWGYQRCPERKSTIWALLSFQLYKVPSILIRQIGMARAYLIYLPNYKAKPTIPELEREYRRASRDTSAGMRKCPVWIDYSNPTFGHYYQHYDPSRPTENCKDVEGARPEYDYEPAPIVRPTALAAGSITSGGSSITSVTMDPIDVKAGEPSVEKDTPPSSQQLSSPYSGSSDSNSFSASSGGKSSLMGRSWLTGIPEGHEGSSGGVLTRKGSQSVYSLDSSSTIDSAIVSESSMKNKGAKSKKQSTVQRTVPQPGQPSDSETKTPRQQTSGDPTDASGAEEQPIQQ